MYKRIAEAEFACGEARATVRNVPYVWNGKQSNDDAATQACAEVLKKEVIGTWHLVWVSSSPEKE